VKREKEKDLLGSFFCREHAGKARRTTIAKGKKEGKIEEEAFQLAKALRASVLALTRMRRCKVRKSRGENSVSSHQHQKEHTIVPNFVTKSAVTEAIFFRREQVVGGQNQGRGTAPWGES